MESEGVMTFQRWFFRYVLFLVVVRLLAAFALGVLIGMWWR
jgi:hypothetical protein